MELCKPRGIRDARGRLVARVVLAMARSKVREPRVTPPMWVQGGAGHGIGGRRADGDSADARSGYVKGAL